ncbi:hypothetical protein BH23GEM3_BH23GEM3_02970 [soil metagenome]
MLVAVTSISAGCSAVATALSATASTLEDLEILEELENLVDFQDARAALEQAKKEGTVSGDDFKKSAGL